MPMYRGIERHFIVYCNLSGISDKFCNFRIAHTSTSSSSSNIRLGDGNWPFVKIISLDCPFGAPFSQVIVNSSLTTAPRTAPASNNMAQRAAICRWKDDTTPFDAMNPIFGVLPTKMKLSGSAKMNSGSVKDVEIILRWHASRSMGQLKKHALDKVNIKEAQPC
jgi:hypothetical protein